MDKPKVVTMNQPPDKLREALDTLKRNLSKQFEHQAIMARIRRKSYLAHIDEGFTPEQSLELVKKLW